MQSDRQTGSKERKERGQAAVEFALVILLLFLVVFGIVDFSRLFFAYATMSHGVREAARYGIVHPGFANQSAIAELARSRMVLIGGDAVVEVEYPDDDPADPNDDPFCSHDCMIRVRATSDFDVWTPVLPHLTIVAQSTMHFE